MDAEYSLNGRLRTPIGLVECICIINALHHHSGIDNFAIDVQKEIFPNRGKNQYWKSIMCKKGELFCQPGSTCAMFNLKIWVNYLQTTH